LVSPALATEYYPVPHRWRISIFGASAPASPEVMGAHDLRAAVLRVRWTTCRPPIFTSSQSSWMAFIARLILRWLRGRARAADSHGGNYFASRPKSRERRDLQSTVGRLRAVKPVSLCSRVPSEHGHVASNLCLSHSHRARLGSPAVDERATLPDRHGMRICRSITFQQKVLEGARNEPPLVAESVDGLNGCSVEQSSRNVCYVPALKSGHA
jgi:hypothetical protein